MYNLRIRAMLITRIIRFVTPELCVCGCLNYSTINAFYTCIPCTLSSVRASVHWNIRQRIFVLVHVRHSCRPPLNTQHTHTYARIKIHWDCKIPLFLARRMPPVDDNFVV